MSDSLKLFEGRTFTIRTQTCVSVCRALLLGLGCNPNLSDVSLDLSCCEVN